MIEFSLSDRSGVPIYRQIQDQVRFAIACARLRPGDQLPTVRALAVDLSVNPNTVIKAYTELEREGVIRTEQGTGTFVAAHPKAALDEAQRQAMLETLCRGFLAEAGSHGFQAREVLTAIRALIGRS